MNDSSSTTATNPDPAGPPWLRWLPEISAAACSAVALMLLGRAAWETGLWCDELLFLRAIELGPWDGMMKPGSSHPPLLRWLMAPWAHEGLPDWLLRLPTLLAAIATIWVWKSLLRRLLNDPLTIGLLLPAMVLNVAWLALAYQLVPYTLFCLMACLHARCWLWMQSSPGRASSLAFALTGALCAWTHFYGINVLLADQWVWLLLWVPTRSWKLLGAWFKHSLLTAAFTLPLLPILLFYLRAESEVEILQIRDYGSYFFSASAELFSRTSFFGLRITQPLWMLWPLAASLLLWQGWLARRRNASDVPHADSATSPLAIDRWTVAAIVCGIYLGGLPAAQLHSVISGEAMWERYTLAGMWIHWPLVLLLLQWMAGRTATRGVAFGLLLLGIHVARLGPEANPSFTNDYRPVVAYLEQEIRPGDAYFAQDIDIWYGDANYERLWFDRYLAADIPLISGPRMRRIQAYENGLALQLAVAHAARNPAPGSRPLERIWIHTLLFKEPWYRRMPTPGWKLEHIQKFPGNYPVALFVREPSSDEGTAK